MKYIASLLLTIALLFSCSDSELKQRREHLGILLDKAVISYDGSGYYPFYRIDLSEMYSGMNLQISIAAVISKKNGTDSKCSIDFLKLSPIMYLPALASEHTLVLSGNSSETGPFAALKKFPVPGNRVVPDHRLSKAYITTRGPDSVVCVSGTPINPEMSPEGGINTVYRYRDFSFLSFSIPGYYQFDVDGQMHSPLSYNVFVSPVKSFHLDRIDRDWYYTQFRTVTTSNCGPTVVSIAIAWATNQDVPVYDIRQYLGWQGSGAVNMEQMKDALANSGVRSEIVEFTGKDQIFNEIEQGRLVGISYNMAGLTFQPKPKENFFNQYYVDHGGHYLALKGFSADKKYFIIYDPIPSDWAENAERYTDGVSMYGRNRYYDADELVAAMTREQILIIYR